MSEPSQKSPEMNAFIKSVMGKDREVTIRGNKCMTCLKEAVEFRDELSRKEYRISGMCQECQDASFGV